MSSRGLLWLGLRIHSFFPNEQIFERDVLLAEAMVLSGWVLYQERDEYAAFLTVEVYSVLCPFLFFL